MYTSNPEKFTVMKDTLGNNRIEVHSIHSSSVDKRCSTYLKRKVSNHSHHDDLVQDKKKNEGIQ